MTSSESWNFKDYFGGIVSGGILCGFGIWMLVEPAKLAQEEYGPGRGGGIMQLVDAIWGIPGGVVLALLGFTILGGTVATLVSRSRKT